MQKKISIKAGGAWNSNCAEDRVKDVWEWNPIYAENNSIQQTFIGFSDEQHSG